MSVRLLQVAADEPWGFDVRMTAEGRWYLIRWEVNNGPHTMATEVMPEWESPYGTLTISNCMAPDPPKSARRPTCRRCHKRTVPSDFQVCNICRGKVRR